jgi:membrane protease YdiL (CAAX protease family)
VIQDAAEVVSPELARSGTVLAIGGLALAPFAIAISRALFPGRNVFFARWRFSHIVLAVIAAAASSAIFPVLFAPLEEHVAPILVHLAASALVLGVGCAVAVACAARLDPSGVRSLGLWPGKNVRACAAGLASYILLLPALVGLEILWPWLLERLGGHFEPQEVAVELRTLSGNALLWAAVLAVVVQPLLEELFFRSFLQPLLVQNLGDRGGVALTAMFFAALHGDSAFLPIFALALLLGSLMLRTQRLSAVWLVHALHNGRMIALIALTQHATPPG